MASDYDKFYRCYSNNDNDSAFFYANKLVVRQDTSGIIPQLYNIYGFLSHYYENYAYKYSEAIVYTNKAIQISKYESDNKQLIDNYNDKSRLLTKIGKYDQAFELAQKSIKLANKSNYPEVIPLLYATIAKIYYYSYDNENALKYYKLVINYPLQTTSNERNRIQAINNITAIISDTSIIRPMLDDAIHVCIKNGYYDNLVMIYLNLSIIFINNDNLQKAEYYLALSKKYEINLFNKISYYYVCGILNIELNKHDIAIEYLNKALSLCKQGEFGLREQDILSLIHKVYAKQSKYQDAYCSIIDYYNIDKIYSKKEILKNLFKTHNEFFLQEERDKLEIEKNRQKYTSLLIILVFIIFSFLSFIIYHFKYRSLKDKNSKLALYKIKFEDEEENLKGKQEIVNLKRMQQYQERILINNIIHNLNNLCRRLNIREVDNEINSLVKELEKNTEQANWAEIETFITESNTDFYRNLLEDFPDLTLGERRLCAFLHMNMTTKEISNVTHKSINSITTARSRLRAKLNIAPDQSIITFLDKYSKKTNKNID